MTVIQFYIPSAAADAITISAALDGALAVGVRDRRLEYVYVGGLGGRCRVTCSRSMGVYLLKQLHRHEIAAGKEVQSDSPIDYTNAIETILEELERFNRGGSPPSAGFGESSLGV